MKQMNVTIERNDVTTTITTITILQEYKTKWKQAAALSETCFGHK